jgi:CDP-diacylglycerol--glycerol-3-phosphate 3-phosphatidyltransferase
MLASQARPQIQRILDPLGRRLAQTGLSPDVVTVVGTVGVSGAAIGFFSRGVFFIGTLVITLFVFSDLLDGLIARAKGTSS